MASFVYKQKLVWVETWKMLGLNLIIAAADTSQAYCGVMLCVGSSPRSDMTWFGLLQ